MPRRLSGYSVADTHRIDQMRSVLSETYGARHFDANGDKTRFHARAGMLHLKSSSLSHCAHGSPVRIDFPEGDLFRFQMSVTGSGRTSVGSKVADCNSSTIVCSVSEATLVFGASYEQFVIRISRTKLEEDLVTLLGTRPKDRISFDMSADYSNRHTQFFRNKILFAAESADVMDNPIPAPLLEAMDQSIRISALYGMPNNFSDLLNRGEKRIAPWQVTLVEEWIDANWAASVTIEKLAEISGVGVRSIFATFRSARGYTPMEYLLRVRLQAARGMLRAGRPRDTVTGIGLACQFSNLSHFARNYKDQFGELPSETLRLARATTHLFHEPSRLLPAPSKSGQ